jgi:hypothetical protein
LRGKGICGKIPFRSHAINPVLENTMSKMHNAFLPAALLVSALVLSACASEPKEKPVAAPAPVETAAPVEAPAATAVAPEPESAPVVEPEPEPAPAVVAEQPAPKPAVHKAKKKVAKAKPAPPVVAPPTPVEAPAPVVQPEAPVVIPLESAPRVVVTPPQEKIPEAGFLEKYWLWLLVLVIAIAGIVTWRSMSKGEEH